MNDIIKLKESDIIRSHPRLTVISSNIVKKNPPMRELTMAEIIDEENERMIANLQAVGRMFREQESKPYKATAISRADVLLIQKNHKLKLKRERRERLKQVASTTLLIGVTALLTLQVLIMAIEELGA